MTPGMRRFIIREEYGIWDLLTLLAALVGAGVASGWNGWVLLAVFVAHGRWPRAKEHFCDH